MSALVLRWRVPEPLIGPRWRGPEGGLYAVSRKSAKPLAAFLVPSAVSTYTAQGPGLTLAGRVFSLDYAAIGDELGLHPIAESGAWADLVDVPSLFPPSAHTHAMGEVTGLLAALGAKLDAAAFTWADLPGKPLTFAPSAHSHVIADVTGLQGALDGKAPLASPLFTGAPSAATAAQGTNSTQLATTAFVQAELTALIGTSPAVLDTLGEIAAALGDDPNFAGTIMTQLAGKQPVDATLTAMAGLAGGADQLAYFTGIDVLAQTPLTAFGRTLLGLADYAALRAGLNVADGATANQTNAFLLDRANHTGSSLALSIAAATLTGAAASSALSITQTWNTIGTPTLIDANLTDTASNANSLLMDLRVGGVSQIRFSAKAFGECNFGNRSVVVDSLRSGTWFFVGSNGQALSSSVELAWTGGSATFTRDTILRRDAANTLALRNGVNPQSFNLYNTFTDASNYERGFIRYVGNALRIGHEAAGTGVSNRNVEIWSGGVAIANFSAGGLTVFRDVSFNNNRVSGGTATVSARTTDGTEGNAMVYLTNRGATGPVTRTLQTYVTPITFRRIASQPFRIAPGGAQRFRRLDGTLVAVGKYLELASDGATVTIVHDGTEYQVIAEAGTITLEP